MDEKQSAAEKAIELIQSGMTVGLGSGSTATWAIRKIGEKVKAGLQINAVATSLKTEQLAKQLMIPVVDASKVRRIDIAIDGADEVDKKGNLIKGGGGSLLREKIIAYASERFHVMVGESKIVEQLGIKFALPVEIVPFATELTMRQIKALDCEPVLRRSGNQLFISDNGNLVVDCKFAVISDPSGLDVKLKMIPGVVETGLFSSQIVTSVFIGYNNGEAREVLVHT
jgi:ribose 5-phosphate isomerase A